ncbi:hypothetical protein GQ651_16865 [Alphaproteobacteria bacterium GH1-50]|uniref:Dynamin N-terminal domain-containing protein n=1 Tax=Kangsaoukella pontilimi TaxID=2691042 RepID=A0A7C9MY16_9RHOB|nr:dynamin family protein [Kangsaoukella pontilimi]MXQ09520.1 hypothetical protein [Kangsaoukella pontilimi]
MNEHEYPDAEIDGDFDVIEAGEPAAPRAPAPLAADDTGTGKPRLCLMGEFSAGKSTLSNLLLGEAALPVNVTATQLPPIWISHGDEAPYRVDLDGEEYELDLERLTDVSVEDTSHIRIFRDAPFLEHCDLIDMPGISDPNMDADVWQRVLPMADMIVWCTHATQAWRQSEAAVWNTIAPGLQARSLLLLTRMDKILSERDRARVVKRVGRETKGLFHGLFPISLTRAMAAGDDAGKWAESGAADFEEALLAQLGAIAEGRADAAAEAAAAATPDRVVMPARIRPRPLAARRTARTSGHDAA